LTLLAMVATLALAGCGGGGDNGSAGGGYGGASATTSKEAPAGAESGVAVITVSTAKEVGPVLVDSNGLTVYDFHKDKGTTSSCYGACAGAWPPVLTEGQPSAGEGAATAQLGTTKRKDGTTQVTYAGHPLYTYVADKKPGEANGNDISQFGAEWYALQGSGEEAEG
jgi:predicted lipoprotein with Yx(FWY)xxD motif